MHARQAIREAAAALLTGLTTTGSRVHQSRLPYATLDDTLLPALLVVTGGESGGDMTTDDAAIQRRPCDLIVSGLAKPSANLDDVLDTIAAEVETALGKAITVTGKSIRIEGPPVIPEPTLDDSLERPVGRIDLTFRLIYFTAAGAPGTLL